MTRPAVLLVAAFVAAGAVAPTSLAEGDGKPPARHVNRITPAAQAAFAKWAAAMVDPVVAGLRELDATVTMRLDVPAEARGRAPEMNFAYAARFVAPAALAVRVRESGDPSSDMIADQMKPAVVGLLRLSLGLARPDDGEEFDADAAVVEGRTVLTVIRFEGDRETSRDVITFDERHLAETMTSTTARGASNTARFTWRKEGERHLLERLVTKEGAAETTATLGYADAGGIPLATRWTLSARQGEGPAMSFSITLSDVTVNGKRIVTRGAGTPAGGDAKDAPAK